MKIKEPISRPDIAISTHGLTKVYKGRTVVNDVSMTVKKGEIYGFIGNNGAGKTTVMRMIAGLAAPNAGSVKIWESDDPKILGEARANMGAIIENPALYPNMSALENLKMRATLLGIKSDFGSLLRTIGLQDAGGKTVKNFSMGMKQRLGIGMAIMGQPEILVLDEPINGLDPEGIFEVRELLKYLNERYGMTVLISSHILGELGKLATAYGVIREGVLVAELRGDDIGRISNAFLRFVVDNQQRAAQVLSGMGIRKMNLQPNNVIQVFERLDQMPVINQTLNKNDVLVLSSEYIHDDLESYFINLMGGGRYNG